MASDKQKAVKLAIEYIDRHKGELETIADQNDMLEVLIAKHDLERNDPLNSKKKIRLNVDRKVVKKTTALFMKGSKVVNQNYLDTIRHDPDAESSGSGDNLEEPEGNEDDEYSPEIPASQEDDIQVDATANGENGSRSEGDASTTVLTAKEDKSSTRESATNQPSTSVAPSSRKRISPTVVIDEELEKKKPRVGGPEFSPRAPTPEEMTTPIRPSHSIVPIEMGSTTATPNAGGLQVSKLMKLSNEAVCMEMNAIWRDIQSFARKLLDGIRVEGASPAVVVLKPSAELRTLYEHLFGTEWLKRTRLLIQKDVLACRDLVEACIGAAVDGLALRPPTPWSKPEDILDSMSHIQEFLDQVVQETDPSFSVQTAVWQASRNMVLSKVFQVRTIRPRAEELANAFMHTLHPQLRAMDAAVEGDQQAFWQKRTDDITSIFIKALTLKAQFETAPDRYECEFATSGAKYHCVAMEEIHEGHGPQEVGWGVTVGISKRTAAEAQSRWICPAKVYTLPRV